MQKKYKIGIVVLILIVIVGFFTWLYTGPSNSVKSNIFSKVPLPVAVVGTQIISSTTLAERTTLANKLAGEIKIPDQDVNGLVLDQMIQNAKITTLANQKKITVSKEELDAEYNSIKKPFDAQNQDFEKSLQENYGLKAEQFKQDILKYNVLQSKLSLWFTGQEQLNSDSYKTSRELLSKLESGQKFEDVALAYTQDEASKNFAGDSGFIAYKAMLPEFQSAVKDLAVNTPKLVSSRYGLHILIVSAIEGEGGAEDKSYNLKQIFIKPADFEKWLTGETKNIKSYKLI